ncbi:MAG: hypothetical protein J0I41_23580 [Filimonas sp.]|nr:hypothetical protein [Filimonas sp.]
MKYYIIILLLLALLSCSSAKEHTNYKYGKKPQILQQPTLLRTDGIYVNTYKGTNESYRFLRFFNNGRCFASKWFDGEMIIDTFQTLNKSAGERTFYRNNGNEIIYENWDGYNARYGYNFCLVDSLSLKKYGVKSRGWSSFEKYPESMDMRLSFIPIAFKEKKADW